MARSLSVDLRSRLVAAVRGGLSRRAAAARFGVSVATAVRWLDVWRRTGAVGPRRQGGDRRTGRIEAVGATILGALKGKVDLTLDELVELLWQRHGQRFARSTVWRFLDRHAMSVKKNGARRRAGQARRRRAAQRVDRRPV
jgi:transposase